MSAQTLPHAGQGDNHRPHGGKHGHLLNGERRILQTLKDAIGRDAVATDAISLHSVMFFRLESAADAGGRHAATDCIWLRNLG